MRAETWDEILDSLILATHERRASWTEDAFSGAFVLTRASGAVVVRGGRDVVVQPVIEIKDAHGEVVDRLGGRSVKGGLTGAGEPALDDFAALDALQIKA